MKLAAPLFIFVLFASLSANVFAHYDPFLPGQHTHVMDVDVHSILLVMGILLIGIFMIKISKKAMTIITKKK